MADIELVIKINEDIAQGIIDGENDTPRNIVRSFQATIADAIKNGTLLPEGHGRLIDENDLWFEDIDDISCVTQRNVENAPTIIEADKEEREDSTRTLQDGQERE